MNRIKQLLTSLLISTTIINFLYAGWSWKDKKHNTIVFDWINSGNLAEEELLFKLSSLHNNASSSVSPLDLTNSSIEFEREKARLAQASSKDFFISARQKGIVIGYASFSQITPDILHINQLIVLPLCQDVGIERELIFSIFKKVPELRKITISVQSNQTSLSKQLKSIGFHEETSAIPALHQQKNIIFAYNTETSWVTLNKKNEPVLYQWIFKGDMVEEEQVFVSAFKKIYEPLTKTELPVRDNLDDFLQNAFEEERQRFRLKRSSDIFLTAKINDKVVGYVSFSETDEPNTAYINQLGVSPEHWRKNIGTELVFSILKMRKNIKRLVVVTRRVNTSAKKFYSQLGFNESIYSHENLDPQVYGGYEFEIKDQFFYL